MKIQMQLADSAQVMGGKLYMLGGGWSIISSPPGTYVIIVQVQIPWAQVGQPHPFKLVLTDTNGNVVNAPDGTPMITIEGEFKTERRPGVLLGAPMDLPMVLPVPALPLEPERYKWQLLVDGRTNLDWELAFTVAPPGVGQLAS